MKSGLPIIDRKYSSDNKIFRVSVWLYHTARRIGSQCLGAGSWLPWQVSMTVMLTSIVADACSLASGFLLLDELPVLLYHGSEVSKAAFVATSVMFAYEDDTNCSLLDELPVLLLNGSEVSKAAFAATSVILADEDDTNCPSSPDEDESTRISSALNLLFCDSMSLTLASFFFPVTDIRVQDEDGDIFIGFTTMMITQYSKPHFLALSLS